MKNKKIKFTILGIIALILVTIGITYAYWLVTKTQTNQNQITAGCLDIAISGEANDISLTNEFPMSDEDGMELVPYEFTVTNNCNTSVDYQVALEATGTEANALAATSLKVALNDNVTLLSNNAEIDPTISGAYESRVLGYGTLAAKDNEGSSATYTLRIWIDTDAPISEMNKIFTSKISVTIGQGVSAQGDTLASLILEDAETNGYLYSTTPDFDTVNADGEYGLYSAEDDYGTSYYFRGDVENNYVKLGTWKEMASDGFGGCYVENDDASCVGGFYETLEACEVDMSDQGYVWCKELKYADAGNDMYWRIIRINGDGTIRLIYDGTELTENGIKHTPSIRATAYDTDSNVGYTYEDGTGVQVDSTIKGVVDAWYETNLESDYGKYIADTIFCNDREVTSGTEANPTYAPYDRLGSNKNPKLTCTQDADKYTVSSAKGNGLLTKPVGLITADEMAFAGGKYNTVNSNYYLYTGDVYFSMSPAYYDRILGSDSVSLLYISDISSKARPVINLKADVKFTGDGTIDNPYKIVTE